MSVCYYMSTFLYKRIPWMVRQLFIYPLADILTSFSILKICNECCHVDTGAS